mmetsp:Transcript_20377/g.78068  ORF Transcript_20377/g.78068 Transcript_20377/m.78068 type:complete len:207 (-) Transcript_20377:1560-2180(-)
MVTGPSLTRCTCMSAPNSPLATTGCSLRATASVCSYKCRPHAAGAAPEKLGRLPPEVSAASVNWLTISRPPPTSCRLRFILPAASPKTRSFSTLAISLSALASVSSGSAQTSISRPGPIAPTVCPAISTRASRTRCSSAITAGPWGRRNEPPRPSATAGCWRAGPGRRSSAPARPRCAAPPRGPASRTMACACAGPRSGAGRPRGW